MGKMARRVILASESPRRKELLAGMGVSFTAVRSDFDEQLDDARDAAHVAEELALGKALAVAVRQPEALVIGSDTIVTFGGKQLGKQPDVTAARQLLQTMSGLTIEVVSSVALVCRTASMQEVRHETARITFPEFTAAALEAYLASPDWQDKAGAVGIQSPLWPGVARLDGSYATILGLPTATLATLLKAQGVTVQPFEPRLPNNLAAAYNTVNG